MGRKLGLLFALFCVGTVLTQGLVFAYLTATGKLNKEKLGRMIAVAQGIEIAPIVVATNPNAEKENPETQSYDERDQGRSLKIRQMDLREMNQANNMTMMNDLKKHIDDEKKLHENVYDAFKTVVDAKDGQIKQKGRDNIREIWEAVRPKQAKEQILQMVEAGEKEDVVAILSSMPISKRAKIISEFKEDAEKTKLNDLLRLIRTGEPEASIIDKTRQQLDRFKTDEK